MKGADPRIEREMRSLEAGMLSGAPNHPWIPLFLIVVRSRLYYITKSRHGHKADWDVVLPGAEMLKILDKKIKTELFTPEAAEDEDSVVHKILLANIGQSRLVDGEYKFVTLLEDSNNARIKYALESTPSQPGHHPNYTILAIKVDKYHQMVVNNVNVKTYALRGVLGPKDLISQIKR